MRADQLTLSLYPLREVAAGVAAAVSAAVDVAMAVAVAVAVAKKNSVGNILRTECSRTIPPAPPGR